MRRRVFLAAASTSPVWIPLGCANQNTRPETPLAHKWGKDWIRGAYSLYTEQYASLEEKGRDESFRAYSELARKGVRALHNLQTREVPFSIRADGVDSFSVVRAVPERFTLRPGMSDAERERQRMRVEHARAFVHVDYEEIRRLNGALSTLLTQLQSVRAAIETSKLEHFRFTRQMAELEKGESPPFELPFEVTREHYKDVLYLLMARMQDDRDALARIERDIVSVGLLCRTTDQNSASLAANIYKALLSIVEEPLRPVRSRQYPEAETERATALRAGRTLFEKTVRDTEYITWEKAERNNALEGIGALLSVVDAMTGLKTSVLFQRALALWHGEGDYLEHLAALLEFVPDSVPLGKLIHDALDLTNKVRKGVHKVEAMVRTAREGGEVVKTGLLALKSGEGFTSLLEEAAKKEATALRELEGGGVLNVLSNFGAARLPQQIVFYKDSAELKRVEGLLAESVLFRSESVKLPVPTGSSDEGG